MPSALAPLIECLVVAEKDLSIGPKALKACVRISNLAKKEDGWKG